MNAKYAGGASPIGTAIVNLPGKNFVATHLSWLTINGSTVGLSGDGTIDNAGDFGFLLRAIDGKIGASKTPDKARVKIWNRATGAIIYDSQMNAVDSAAPTIVLGGGTINIKK